MKNKLLVTLLYLGTVTTVTTTATTIGIPSSRLNTVYTEQRNSQWCWAACIQMVMNFNGVSVSQEDIVRRSFGTDPYGYLPNFPGSHQMITANINGWGFDWRNRQYIVGAILANESPIHIAMLMYSSLKDGHPVIIGYSTGGSVDHAVVVTAMEYDGELGRPDFIITSITVRDPWPGVGRKTYRGTDLGPRINAAWRVVCTAE